MSQSKKPPGTRTFGQRLQQLREDARLTRAELAEAAGLTRQMVTAIEAGRRPDPSWSTVLKLADALNVTPNDFMG